MIQNSVFLEFPKQRVRFEILPSQKVYTNSLLVPIKLKKNILAFVTVRFSTQSNTQFIT